MSKRRAEFSDTPTKLLKEDFKIIDVEGDGNCFYRAVSVCLNNNENHFKKIKRAALKFLEQNHTFLLEDFSVDYVNRAIAHHSADDTWADDLMIFCTAHCFEIQIVIESPSYLKELCYLEECPKKIFLVHSNSNHFKAKLISEKSCEKKKNAHKANFSAKKPLNADEKLAIKENRIDRADFVNFSGKADTSRYNDIHKFIKENKLPRHLLSKSSKAIENWKYNAKEYKMFDFPLSKFSRSRLAHFSPSDNTYYTIPLRNEDIQIIEKVHAWNGKHLSLEKTIAKLYETGIKYTGCTISIRNYIAACATCNIIKPPKVNPKKYTPIDSQRPREMILFDCVFLKEKLFGKNARLVTAIDHFSKYGWAQVISWVNSENTSILLSKVFEHCNSSIESVLTDNGSEFKARFADFLKDRGIPHKKGAPYKPTTQGCVERFNKTIKEELKGALERNSDLVLTEALEHILDDYNNWKHFSTGKKPSDLFNIINEEDLEEVRKYRNQKLTINFKSKEKHLNLKENSNVLIRNDIILEKSSGIWYTKNEASFSNGITQKMYDIVGIVRVVSSDHIVVQIKKDSVNFKKNSIIMVKESALKEVSDEAMENCLKNN